MPSSFSQFEIDFKSLLSALIGYYILCCLWTFLCIYFEEFSAVDTGLVTGAGYLLIFSFSLWNGGGDKLLITFLKVTLLTTIIFLFASFGISLLVAFFSDNVWAYYILNSLFVSAGYVFFLDQLFNIEKKGFITLASTLLLLLHDYLLTKDLIFLRFTLQLHDRLIMFILFQGFLIIPLMIGLRIKGKSN